MGLLISLGVDSTLWIQFGLFCFCALVLSKLLFKPYLKAYLLRLEKTQAAHLTGQDMQIKIQSLQSEYETLLRDSHRQVQEIYQELKKQTSEEKEKVLAQARKDSEQEANQERAKMHEVKGQVGQQMKSSVQELSQLVSDKLLGRNADA